MPSDYAKMAKAIEYLHKHVQMQPSLDELASSVQLSPFHFQRLFKRWVGVSPKRYLQNLVAQEAKLALRDGATLLETTYDVGLSSSGRLHDLFVSLESVTPGEYKTMGESIELKFGLHWTPFGPCCIALTDRGICSLQFLENASLSEAKKALEREWPRAMLAPDTEKTAEIVYRIFHGQSWNETEPFHLHLRGTNFQIQVWRALLRIPTGKSTSYSKMSASLGRPTSHARAVASAVAANPVAYLIPCHRVIRESGSVSGYRWGVQRKQHILNIEGAL